MALKVYGKMFKSRKTYPFIVKYAQNKKMDTGSRKRVDGDFIFRTHSLNSILEFVKKINRHSSSA